MTTHTYIASPHLQCGRHPHDTLVHHRRKPQIQNNACRASHVWIFEWGQMIKKETRKKEKERKGARAINDLTWVQDELSFLFFSFYEIFPVLHGRNICTWSHGKFATNATPWKASPVVVVEGGVSSGVRARNAPWVSPVVDGDSEQHPHQLELLPSLKRVAVEPKRASLLVVPEHSVLGVQELAQHHLIDMTGKGEDVAPSSPAIQSSRVQVRHG